MASFVNPATFPAPRVRGLRRRLRDALRALVGGGSGAAAVDLENRYRGLAEAHARLVLQDGRHERIAALTSDYRFSFRQSRGQMPQLEWKSGSRPMAGYSIEELMQSRWLEMLYPGDREAVFDWGRALRTGYSEPLEFRILDRAGEPRWVSVRIFIEIEDGSGDRLLYAAVQDVSTRKLAEEALRMSEERYRALAESVVDVIFETTSQGRLVYVSPSLETVLGHKPSDALGHMPFDMVHPDDRHIAIADFAETVKGRESSRPVIRVIRKDGEWAWIECVGRRYLGDGEQRMVFVMRDVSERIAVDEVRRRHEEELELEVARRTGELAAANRTLRELQGRLLQAERLGAFEDLAGSVAHAINNPLTALIGTAELALEEQHHDRMERVARLAYRVRDVVSRTLEAYRQGTIKLTPEDAGAMLGDVREQLIERATRQGVSIEMQIEDGLPTLRADRPLLTAALVSLAENGLDAMPDGGRLQLEAAVLHRRRVVTFRVTDSGPGIPVKARKRVFEAFYTTRGGGTGLGLSIARGVIQGHEGRVRIDDAPHGGAQITVEIPAEKLGRGAGLPPA